MLTQLEKIKDNVRSAIQTTEQDDVKEQNYG
jgi:hypothetical protein